MSTVIVFHEVENGDHWANAWKEGAGSRHELFDGIAKVRTFRDPDNPNMTGGMLEVSDMEAFEKIMTSDEGRKAMEEDGVKVETVRILKEFTP